MRILYLTAGFVVLALLLVSGCVGNTADVGDTQKTGPGEQELTENAEMEQETPEDIPEPEEEPESMLPDGANIVAGDIVIENDLYHSGELMRFNVTVSSDIYLEEVLVSA
ncbi:MAG: hypothetical protein KAT35_01785, partial [Candidatus Aenigmarchaeota archaeon]|nr:hypothetical protein [Candidatus Aenigmarchaeota archaeon]